MSSVELLTHWALTPWKMNGRGGWTDQPIILVEGELPFFADHPLDYIERLEQMHDTPGFEKARWWVLIGQLRDGLEQHWDEEQPSEKGNHRNGQRASS